jgi:ABC-type polysaccharide/polyol phosphate transport system ATPase subunit
MSSDRKPDDPIISLRQVSKKYPIYDRPSQKLIELLTLGRKQMHREFWALKDLDLEVHPGTTLGLVGPNGSGKSTLLQLVAGILSQTRGDCYVRGNVYMNGAINGLTRTQIDDRFDDILDFAEIGEFIEQPVKTYSSGMFVRLAFAVAIHVDPEILLVDEALAVGDLIFQHRCINRIRRMRQEGKTILFVTHDLQALVRFCDKAILLDKGRKIGEGSPSDIAHQYQALVFDRERKEAGAGEEWVQQEEDGTLPVVNTIPHIHDRFGAGGAEIQGVTLLSSEGAAVNDARAGEELRVLVSVLVKQDLESPIVGITIRDRLGAEVTATNSTYEGVALPALTKGTVVTVAFGIKMPEIRPGSYSISPAVASGNIWEHKVEDWIDNAYIFNLAETGLVYGLMKWSFDVAYRKSSS